MPTIRDVAKRAGVSLITISRVINDYDYVSKETRERVETVIEELGYVPNMLGPSLRFKRTMTVALIMTDITNPFWTTVARGVEDVAQANGYSTTLCNTDESELKQGQYLRMLLRRRIDGVLFVPASSNDPKPVQLIQKQGVPVVLLDRQVPNVKVDVVRADSEHGAYLLTKHLLSLGHECIAMLNGPQSVSTAVDRFNGFQRAITEANLKEKRTLFSWGKFTQESGYAMAKKVIASALKPTAILSGNNFIAIGAYQALCEQGLLVPDDIALVTFDDPSPTSPFESFLTTVTQPAREMGQRAAQLLIDRLDDGFDNDFQQIVLPIKLIIGTSSGKCIT
jgi:LacI family transcriptional regulator